MAANNDTEMTCGDFVKGEPGTRPASTRDCIRVPLEATAAEGINAAYTAVLEGVPFR